MYTTCYIIRRGHFIANISLLVFNTQDRGAWFYWSKVYLLSQNILVFNGYFTNKWTNTRHFCTYLNTFFIVVSNMLIKFHKFCLFVDLSSALACRVESIKTSGVVIHSPGFCIWQQSCLYHYCLTCWAPKFYWTIAALQNNPVVILLFSYTRLACTVAMTRTDHSAAPANMGCLSIHQHSYRGRLYLA